MEKELLSPQAVAALEKANEYLSAGRYNPVTIRNYLGALHCIFLYYPDTDPMEFTEVMVTNYLLSLSKTHGYSRAKCKMSAQSIAFFMRRVAKRPCASPGVVYSKHDNKLSPVMLHEEITQFIDGLANLKHRTIFMLFYKTGMRLSDIVNCRITDIDSKNMRIKVAQNKGAKDHHTILTQQVLLELRAYYLTDKPKEYLFNGDRPGEKYSVRSIKHEMLKALTKAEPENKKLPIYCIRLGFVTYLMDNRADAIVKT